MNFIPVCVNGIVYSLQNLPQEASYRLASGLLLVYMALLRKQLKGYSTPK